MLSRTLLAAGLAALATALPQPTAIPDSVVSPAESRTTAAPQPRQASTNPFAGYKFYANPYYSSEVVNLAIPSLPASLKPAASAVANVGSFVWMDTRAKIPLMETYLADIKKRNAAGEKLMGTFVVYDLPERDCAAAASNGELSLDKDGANIYKTQYIDVIAGIIAKYPTVKINLAIGMFYDAFGLATVTNCSTTEPDSLANMVTNLNVAKCSKAASAYKELTAYAIKKLNFDNVNMYLDGGHAGWLGWDANIGPAAKLYAEVCTYSPIPNRHSSHPPSTLTQLNVKKRTTNHPNPQTKQPAPPKPSAVL
jgi:cellulose 1,4-beta-cellobiosidase